MPIAGSTQVAVEQVDIVQHEVHMQMLMRVDMARSEESQRNSSINDMSLLPDTAQRSEWRWQTESDGVASDGIQRPKPVSLDR